VSGPEVREVRFRVSSGEGDTSAVLLLPAAPKALFVLGHGAGAGMRHTFMETVARLLAARHLATFRYQFAYMERGRRRPDPRPTLLATVHSALAAAVAEAPGLPTFAGGKSMGGRMTSLAAAASPLERVRGLVFFGFPLHPSGRPSTDRAAHLAEVGRPMLFLQGTRDRLADLELLSPVCERLGLAATLHVVDGADHSFQVLKRSGRSMDEVFDELVDTTERWVAPFL
jgi:predicted alpha/beta-hydrolase family hydrolase